MIAEIYIHDPDTRKRLTLAYTDNNGDWFCRICEFSTNRKVPMFDHIRYCHVYFTVKTDGLSNL